MHDQVVLEEMGVPAVAVITSLFEIEARARAEMLGAPDIELAIIAHPLTAVTPEQIAQRARQAAPRVAAVLTGGAEGGA